MHNSGLTAIPTLGHRRNDLLAEYFSYTSGQYVFAYNHDIIYLKRTIIRIIHT